MFTENNKSVSVRVALVLILLAGVFGVTLVQADTAIRYVKWDATGANNGSSWTDAYTDLQSALAVAASGDEIWVAAGTYKPTSGTDRTVSFALKNGVAVYGGFAGGETQRDQRNFQTNITILSGDIGTIGDISDNSYHVVVGSNTDNSAVLDGFTVTGGNTHGSTLSESRGGGLYNNFGSPTIRNVIFSDNYADFGGGMATYGDDNPIPYPNIPVGPVITNVVFRNNSAIEGGGLFSQSNAHTILTEVTFENNTAARAGGGMEDRLGKLDLADVIFHDNSSDGAAGGFQNFSRNANLTNVTFSGNSALMFGGGMVNADDNTIMTNVTFHGNSAEFGGGMWNSHTNLTLTNTTISGNSASTTGGGIYSEGNSNLIVRNAILWGNNAPNGAQIYDDASVTTISDSFVQGGYIGGVNIIITDPLLGPLQNNGGFTQTMALLPGSPAIDAGDDANCPATDQRGVTRPQGSHCDMGAYEYIPVSTPTATFTPTSTPIPTVTPTVTKTSKPGKPPAPTKTPAPTRTPVPTRTHRK